MLEFAVKYFYRIVIVYLAIKRLLYDYSLGEEVLYKDRVCILCQGVDNPYWNLSNKESDEYYTHIHKDEFKKYWTYDNIKETFKSNYSFYMTNWFDIWVRKAIEAFIRKMDTKKGRNNDRNNN